MDGRVVAPWWHLGGTFGGEGAIDPGRKINNLAELVAPMAPFSVRGLSKKPRMRFSKRTSVNHPRRLEKGAIGAIGATSGTSGAGDGHAGAAIARCRWPSAAEAGVRLSQTQVRFVNFRSAGFRLKTPYENARILSEIVAS